MSLDNEIKTAITAAFEGRKFHPWKPNLGHDAALQQVTKAVEEFGERVAAKTTRRLSATGSVQAAPKKPEIQKKLDRTHQYMDRIRLNIEDAYNEGETDPTIILANIESILSAANHDDIR